MAKWDFVSCCQNYPCTCGPQTSVGVQDLSTKSLRDELERREKEQAPLKKELAELEARIAQIRRELER